MEMEAVANIFDRDGDGYIDYNEFVAALRPNRDVSTKVYEPLDFLYFSIWLSVPVLKWYLVNINHTLVY